MKAINLSLPTVKTIADNVASLGKILGRRHAQQRYIKHYNESALLDLLDNRENEYNYLGKPKSDYMP